MKLAELNTIQQRESLSHPPHQVQGLLEATLRGLLQMLVAERGSICWLDAPSQELVVTVAIGPQTDVFLGYRQRLGYGIAGQVAASRQPLLIRHMSDEGLLERRSYRTQSFLCIPLQTPNELFGVVNFTDKITGDAFTAQDLERAVEVVGQLATVLEALRHSDLLQRQVDLTEKFAAIGRVAAGLVHELSNPLAGVSSYTNLMLDRVPDGYLRDYLLMIKSGLNRMVTTVRTLSQFAQRPTDPRPILDVNQTVEEALSALGLPFSYPLVTVVRKFGQQIPLISDFGFAQVVSNLIKNACDAMPRGGTLTVSTESTDSSVVTRVSDTGVGIPPEHQSLIFEPFFTTKLPGQGTGLGLAIAQEIVTRYQGTLSMESVVGQGSVFSVHLPLNP